MENKKPLTHAVAGLGIAVLVIIIAIITMALSGGTAQPGSGFMTYVVIIAGLILFIRLYGAAKNNQVTFGELFSYGFKATAVYTIIFIGFLFLLGIVMPEFKDQVLKASSQQMESGSTKAKQLEESRILVEKNFWTFLIAGTTMFLVIIGAIGSLIGAAVTKKNPPLSTDQFAA